MFSSLMKQNKKAKICFVICFTGFFFLNFLCYEVFAKQKKTELPRLYYSYPPVIPVPDTGPGAAQVQTSPGRGLLAKQVRDD